MIRFEGWRPRTARNALTATSQLKTRLCKGEKRDRRRMTEVCAIHDVAPFPRTPDHIVGDPAGHVLADEFDEVDPRDPRHQRRWIALIDGNSHQIDRIDAEVDAHDAHGTVVIDFIHVLGCLCDAARSAYLDGDSAAEAWVRDLAQVAQRGHPRQGAAGIRP